MNVSQAVYFDMLCGIQLAESPPSLDRGPALAGRDSNLDPPRQAYSLGLTRG